MSKPIEFEPIGYLTVVSMDKDSARRFFGMPDYCKVEDVGPPTHNAHRYKEGAREFRVYPPTN